MPTFFTVERKRVRKGLKGKKKRVTLKRKVYLVGHRNPGRFVVSKPAKGSRPKTVKEPPTVIPYEYLAMRAMERPGDRVTVEISFEGEHPRSDNSYQDIVFGGGQITEGLDERWPFVEESRDAIERMVEDEVDGVLSDGFHNVMDLMDIDFNERLGDRAALIIADKIRTMSSPPNAPATIKRKGFNNPLVETGTMQDSIIVEVSVS